MSHRQPRILLTHQEIALCHFQPWPLVRSNDASFMLNSVRSFPKIDQPNQLRTLKA